MIKHNLTEHTKQVLCISISHDSKYLASGGHDKTLKIWDLETCQVLHSLKTHMQSVTSVDFSSDGTFFASGSFHKDIRVWSLKPGKTPRTVRKLSGHTYIIMCVRISPDCGKIASSSEDGTIIFWDAYNGVSRVCVCVCVCMHACMYVCIYVYVCMYACIYVCVNLELF
jgi:WD40 repeat protein